MNILIVTAHPSSLSHTKRIAETYAEASKARGHDVQILDLYAKENRMDYLTFENIREYQSSKIQMRFKEQVRWAHEIVVIHPIWWAMVPAIMKNWVDMTFWMRFAYRYTKEGDVEKLLVGKTAKIFATAGGPGWYHYIPVSPLRAFWGICVFNFSGVDVTDVKIMGNLDKHKGEKAEVRFNRFLKKIKASAAR